ncbi:MAG: phosphatidylglycerophosphatase A [Elusimicrobia bacterium]|nr:phosphatidylglycerophosphatase A [Elusimicrobiota bacterium]
MKTKFLKTKFTAVRFSAFLASGFFGSHLLYRFTEKFLNKKKKGNIVSLTLKKGWKGCGLWGSFLALIFWILLPTPSLAAKLALLMAITLGAVFTATLAENYYRKKDDSRIVVDEFAGYLWAAAFLPKTPVFLAASFILFRALDVWKPLGIRRLEKLPHGFGCVIDDVASGLLTAAVLAFFLAATGIQGRPMEKITLHMPNAATPLRRASGAELRPEAAAAIEVELARTPQERARGLMFRKELPAGEGMLFVFDYDGPQAMWMKNMLIDLDFVFLDEDGFMTAIEAGVPHPQNQNDDQIAKVYGNGKYVLEVGAGQAERLGLAVGQTIALPGL